MLKRVLSVLLLAIFLFAGVAQAQTNDLPNPGLLPDSPFYFLKRLVENIGTFLTFNEVAKAGRFLHLAEKRLAEANALVAKGKSEMAEKTIERYQKRLNQALAKAKEAKAKGLDTDEVLAKISEATVKHQAVLADVYERVPEEAKSAIKRAMEAGMRGHEEDLEAVSGQKREEVMKRVERERQEVEQRLEELRDKGIPIPTIPTKEEMEMGEEVEERIPVRPETRTPATPPRLPTQEQKRKGEEVEMEKPEVPEVETEIPGGVERPEVGRPETPGGRP